MTTTEYPFYDKCECGGEYEVTRMHVLDVFPAYHGVKCKNCGKQSRTVMMSEAEFAGWTMPEWKRKIEAGQKPSEPVES